MPAQVAPTEIRRHQPIRDPTVPEVAAIPEATLVGHTRREMTLPTHTTRTKPDPESRKRPRHRKQ